MTELRAGACPYCGFPCGEFSHRLRTIQVILFAFFASTLVYGLVVAVLELARGYAPPLAGPAPAALGGTLLGASLGVFIASLLFERRAAEVGTVTSHTQRVIILAAMAEVPAVFGLVMYLLTGSLQWLVAFLALSWLLFVRLGLQLARILRGIAQSLRT
ncbi:MAG: hypothetical protein AB7Y46_19265 [Armatimonadota bacterium]